MAARSSFLTLLLVHVLGASVIASCTLTRTSRDECKTNAECRTAFGAAQICGAEGLCAPAPPNARCTTTFPADLLTRPDSYPNVQIVGALMDRSVESQRARENAIRLAATQVNEQQGLDGKLFGVVFCDVAENPQYDSLKRTDAAVAAGKYLADSLGVPAIIGPSSSTDALAVFNALKDQDVLVISPSATSPALTGADVASATEDKPGLLWRTAPPDTLQGGAIVRHLTTAFPAVTSVEVIAEKGPYGDALASVFTAGFQQNGRTAKTTPYATSSERDAAIVNAGAGGAKVVLFFSSQTGDGVAFLNAAQTLSSYATTTLFLTDSAANRDLLTGAAGAASVFPRVVGSRPAVPQGTVYELFRTSFNAAFKQDPNTFSFVPHTYDATWLVFYGTAWAVNHEKKISGAGIARGLRHVSAPGEEIQVTPANWKRVAGELSQGKSVNLTGASGTLDYDATTEETTGLVEIWKISADGKAIEVVTSIDPRL